jgi:hemerythrin superfamily protein
MNYIIPKPLKVEHEELHAQLLKATQEEGEVGSSAKNVAKILHNHFIKEEEYAIPPLGLLDALSKGIVTNEMKSVLDMTEKLKAELPKMLEEHKLIIEALHNLISASKNENKIQYAEFAERLILHAQMEEEVMYPAAILVGEYIKLKL